MHLETKLAEELPGILAWAVRGCLDWQYEGLCEPAEVTSATAAYRSESDVVEPFFASRCIFGDDERCIRRELREAYESWARECGATPVGAKRFAEGLRTRGVKDTTVRTTMAGVSRVHDGWRGVRLKTAFERDQEAVQG